MDRIIVRAFAILITICAATPASSGIVHEIIKLPVTAIDQRGRSVSQQIDVTIVHDSDAQRSPFLIFNHGRSSEALKQSQVMAAQHQTNARYFVSKDFTVFIPIRIVYGSTARPDVENSSSCEGKKYRRGSEAAGDETVGLIELAKTLPYIDPTIGLVIG